jgi:hypothetical protein
MYADASTVREAREQYFAANGFSADTYVESWAKIKVGPLPVVFPNTASRKRALPIHDLHHIATGYETTIEGEGEIAAFEIGGGCGNYAAAWLINAGGFGLGLVMSPSQPEKTRRARRGCTQRSTQSRVDPRRLSSVPSFPGGRE